MMQTPQFCLSAKDRLWLVLQSHEGTWQSVHDLMFDAGFLPAFNDRVTHFTSFYWNLSQLRAAAGSVGYEIFLENRFVMLRKKAVAA